MTACPECVRCLDCGAVIYCLSLPADAQRDDRICTDCHEMGGIPC